MKKIYLAALLLLCFSASYAQNNTVSIHDSWIRYATDTTLTYQQITHVCDSLFAMVGYTDTATVSDTSDASAEFGERDGSPHVLYLRWRNFWAICIHRCPTTPQKNNRQYQKTHIQASTFMSTQYHYCNNYMPKHILSIVSKQNIYYYPTLFYFNMPSKLQKLA